jgi:hypothetical protein
VRQGNTMTGKRAWASRRVGTGRIRPRAVRQSIDVQTRMVNPAATCADRLENPGGKAVMLFFPDGQGLCYNLKATET